MQQSIVILVHDIIKTIDLESNQVLHLHQTTEDYDDPLQHFTYALRAPETKRQYPKRIKISAIGTKTNDIT